MKEPLTEKQKQVLDQVQELLTEHFDGHVYSVRVDNVDENSTDGVTAGGFGGSASGAIGLCEVEKGRLLRHCLTDYHNDDVQ